MFTLYEKTSLTISLIFLLIALLNLTIGIINMRANRRVASHTDQIRSTAYKIKDNIDSLD
jgi:hypothetical protein